MIYEMGLLTGGALRSMEDGCYRFDKGSLHMSTNAQWRVRYEVLDGTGSVSSLYLCSRDGRDPKKAHKLARDTAKARLTKKGLKVRILGSECVG